MTRIVEKSWGREIIFADQDEYCGKFLVYDKAGARSSMHFHMVKKESWYVQFGSFEYTNIEPIEALEFKRKLYAGDTITLIPGTIHQLTALEDASIIVEVSTKDNPADTYRIKK